MQICNIEQTTCHVEHVVFIMYSDAKNMFMICCRHTCQPCNTAFLDHSPKFSLNFCDFPGSRKNARFFMIKPIQSLLGLRAIDRCRAHDSALPPALELISHDLRPLPRPDLTALQRCTTKNPRTTRHSGMKRGIFPQNPGSREVGLNSGKIGM